MASVRNRPASVLGLVALLCAATSATRVDASVKCVWSPDGGQKRAGEADTVMVVVLPSGSMEGRLIEDALTVELLAKGTKITGRAKAERILRDIEADRRARSSSGEEDGKEAAADSPASIFDVASKAGAHAILSVTALATQTQTNVYDKTTGRVTEVRTTLSVHMISMTMIDVKTGDVLAAAIGEYAQGVAPSQAAAELVGPLPQGDGQ
jgi:hypothetical protein